MTQWRSQEGRSHVETAGAESDCLAWSNRAARLDAALYIALLTRMRMNYIEGCVAQSLKMPKSSTPTQNQAQIQNRILSQSQAIGENSLHSQTDNIFAPLTKISRIHSP